MTNLDSVLKSRDSTLPIKGPYSQSYGFSSSHAWIWELDHKEGWAPNWYFWTVVLEKTLEGPLDCKEIQPVNPKGNQPWIFIARTDAEAPIFWPPDVKSWLTGKDPEAGRERRQRRRGQQRMRWLDSITDLTDMNLSKRQETVKDRGAWHAAVYRVAKSQTQLINWTTTTNSFKKIRSLHCCGLRTMKSATTQVRSPPVIISFILRCRQMIFKVNFWFRT